MLRPISHVGFLLARNRKVTVSFTLLGFGIALLLSVGIPQDARAQVDKEELQEEDNSAEMRAKARQVQPELSVLEANNLPVWFRRNGLFEFNADPFSNANGSFPKGARSLTTFAQGLMWGGKVLDGTTPTVRVNGSTYFNGLAPGGLNPDGTPEDATNPARFHVWRVHRNWTDPEVLREAAAYVDGVEPSAVNESRLAEVRDQYAYDWNNWPAGDGAPYQECNGQSGYQPADPDSVAAGLECGSGNLKGDIPGRTGAEQTIWVVTNDIGSRSSGDASLRSYGSPAIGMEVQFTLWSYERPAADPLGNANFIRSRLIYKGVPNASSSAQIDSMFVSWWADPDIGSNVNDFAGVDTSRSLGFAYNGTASDAKFDAEGLPPGAGGWDLLQVPGATASEQNVSAFSVFSSSGGITDPDPGTYSGSLQWYNLMRGVKPRPKYPQTDSVVNPLTGTGSKFMFSGDPVSGTGWTNGTNLSPADVRLASSAGPFTMAKGDTVDVVVGKMAAVGQDRLGSLTKLRSYDNVVEYATDPPISNPTDLTAQAPDSNTVELRWAGVQDTNLDRYEIYRSTEPIAGRLTNLSPIATVQSATSYTDDSETLEPFETYHYRVRAANGTGGESIFSNEATTTPAPLPAPKGLTAFASNANKVEVTWEPVLHDSLDEYRVYRDTASIGGAPSDLEPFATVDSANTTYVEEPDSGATYHYRVTAADESGDESPFSNEGQAAAGPVPPPTNLTATVSDAEDVQLNWTGFEDPSLEQYRIYRRTVGLPEAEVIATVGPSTTSYVDDPALGATYVYFVRAVDEKGRESLPSSSQSAPIPLQLERADLAVVADYEEAQRDTSTSGGTSIQFVQSAAPSSSGNNALKVDASESGAVTINRRANLPTSDRLSFLVRPAPSTNFTLTLTFVEEVNGSEASYDVTIPVDSGETWRRYEVPFSDVGTDFNPVASRSGGNGPFLRLQVSADKQVTYQIDEFEFGTETRALVELENFDKPAFTSDDFGHPFSNTDAVATSSDGFTARTFSGGSAAYRFSPPLTVTPNEAGVLSFRAKASTSDTLSVNLAAPNGAGGFTNQSVAEAPVSGNWERVEIPLTELASSPEDVSALRDPGVYQVQFQWLGGSGDFTLDDVKILAPSGKGTLVTKQAEFVDANTKVSFPGTGLTINFTGISGLGNVTVRRYLDPPRNPSGIDESNVISRFTVEAADGLEIGAGTKLQFDADEFDIQNPSNVVIYRRSTPGEGVFDGLKTTYEASDEALVTTVESFGELALARSADSVAVWAGDTDNDGTVDQADVLPLGTYWDQSGPARSQTGCSWTAENAAPWSPEAATYADANGDGTVNQNDVLCLGVNWGKRREGSSPSVLADESQSGETAGQLKLRRTEQSGSTLWVELHAQGVESLMGVAAELTYDSEVVSVKSVKPGARMGESPLLHSNTDETKGVLGLGVSRKGTASKAGADGPVMRVKLRSEAEQPGIGLRDGKASTAEGMTVALKTSDGGLRTLPEEVTLEAPAPNPVQNRTTIEYALPEAQEVRLTVYDVLGREVAVLVNERQEAGRKEVRIDASHWASGAYFYRLKAKEVTKTDRFTIVR